MQLVAVPGLLVALAVFIAADVACGRQTGEHLIEVPRGVPFRTRSVRDRRERTE